MTGTGEDENAALQDLVDRLTGVPKPDGNRMDELRRRLRFAYLEGARNGRKRTSGGAWDELVRVVGRYTGR